LLILNLKICYFNPRSREGSDYSHKMQNYGYCYFNPRSREGSDIVVGQDFWLERHISIHAPARGATKLRELTGLTRKISIHAPARGATIRTPKTKLTKAISIHAPARGATDDFTNQLVFDYEFQSTLPRGARLKLMIGMAERDNFNPRSREGSDIPKPSCQKATYISIHAPARGATSPNSERRYKNTRFQSTLPRGERPLLLVD